MRANGAIDGVRRVAKSVSIAVIAAISGSMFIGAATPSTGAARTPMLWGAHVAPRTAMTTAEAITAFEAAAGRKLALVRNYGHWGDPFPDQLDNFVAVGGRTIMLSIKSQRANGVDIPWASVAGAQPGSTLYTEMQRMGDEFRSFGQPIYLIFHHEPEADANTKFGTSAEFIAAWRRFADVIRGRGATNVRFLWTMIDYSFTVPASDRRAAASWYPGDGWVDGIGADAYNWASCRGRPEAWRSLGDLIEPARLFGLTHPTKEMWLPEYGTAEDPAVPGRKGSWLNDAAALFSQPAYSQFRGLAYFHDDDASNPGCNWWIDTSTTSSNGYAMMGAAPIFGGTSPIAEPPCPTGGVYCAAQSLGLLRAVRQRNP